jgi:hypothetical protein
LLVLGLGQSQKKILHIIGRPLRREGEGMVNFVSKNEEGREGEGTLQSGQENSIFIKRQRQIG